MADIVSTSETLSIVAEFADGDDRTITLQKPRGNLTWADIEALSTAAAKVLIGDRAQANFYRFKEAFTRETEITYLDIQGT